MLLAQHREFACAIVIDTKGRFLFQHRDDIPDIVLPGRICLFGGHREGGESFDECIARELHEELSYAIPNARIERLGGHRGIDIDRGYGTAACDFYVARDVPLSDIVVTEGSLVVVDRSRWQALGSRLAPIAVAALELFDGREASPPLRSSEAG